MSDILTITGSDNAGWSGLQLDLKTILSMGGHAQTAATCIVMQDSRGIRNIYDFSPTLVEEQIACCIADVRPSVVKVGLVRGAETVRMVRNQIVGIRSMVLAPGIISSRGEHLVDDDTLTAIRRYLIPEADLLVVRCNEAELLLGYGIDTNEEMLHAARDFNRLGAKHILIRGGRIHEGRLTALLWPEDKFFSSYNIEGWQQHGVGGALSAAIAMRIAEGDDIATAISNAHQFIHSQVVYVVQGQGQSLRSPEIFNQFMNLLADNYTSAHDVAFYAERMSITTRYLSQVTERVIAKSPKRLIAEYLMNQARQLLLNSRLTVQEISHHLGFASQAAFNTFFRKYQHCTPSEFRKF